MLHYHNILDHMGSDDLKDLARKGYLPHSISLAEKVICAACQMGKAHKLARGSTTIVNEEIKNPGDLVNMDQAESTNPGRPLTHSGRNCKQKIHVVTIFVDIISKKVFAGFQCSTNATETVKSKQEFEIESMSCGVGLKSFRADNGIFRSAEFHIDLQEKDQRITFCGVGAHHQNGVAERHIRTFVEKSRTVLLNACARWPGKIDMELWTFALRHVVNQWNNAPRKDLNYQTPDERFNKFLVQLKMFVLILNTFIPLDALLMS